MKYGRLPRAQLPGAVLAYSLRVGGEKWKKGRRLTAADVARLRAAGAPAPVVAKIEAGDIDENRAAAAAAAALTGGGFHAAAPGAGRVNLIADADGVLSYNVAAAHRFNAVSEEITLATLPPYAPVTAGALLATVKIIPFAVSKNTLAAIRPFAFRVHPYALRRAALIQTTLPDAAASLADKTRAVTAARLRVYGAEIIGERRVAHARDAVAAALHDAARDDKPEVILIAPAAAVSDARDDILLAVADAGGKIARVGMPVDPGNLLFLAKWRGMPVVGLPGCARSPKLNGFDLVLNRVFAKLRLTSQDIARMGAGGLLGEIPARPLPRQKARAVNIAAVLLAAGASKRMGAKNKLLRQWRGKPLLCHAVATLKAARRRGKINDIIAVTGGDGDKIAALLKAEEINTVANADYADGMASSLRRAVAALPAAADAALIFLADMPLVTAEDIAALTDAFAAARPDIVVPVHRGKRGNPVLLARSQFSRLMRLRGDTGMRAVFADAGANIVTVDAGGGVLADFDTPAHFKAHGEGKNA